MALFKFRIGQSSAENESPSPSHYHAAVLPPELPVQNCVVSPYYHHLSGLHWRDRRVLYTASLLLLAALLFIFWPSDPEVKIARLHVNHMQVHTAPIVAVDISLVMTLKVRNWDVYSMDITRFEVAVGYRGKTLGHVTSEHGHVRARGSSYVEAVLELNGVGVFSDVVYMLEDLARGTVPFDTVTQVVGWLGFSFVKFPLKVDIRNELECGPDWICIGTVLWKLKDSSVLQSFPHRLVNKMRTLAPVIKGERMRKLKASLRLGQ
ncbi:hypothetical protein Gohar_003438 [Gossypium harknessii]|uniref:Late embryogenesis abundant protein LEA-2 subgroup domain-containing protein n=1 Tax=Gossypium harknessii TaxID=34285 RepID=A0A7J9HPA1_9ROSI|nr:hypothetical protein [Gossypium harknessii]